MNMAPHPATATFSEFASLHGCTKPYVTALRKAGRLVLTDDGKKVRVAESLARIEATRDPAMAAVAARHAQERGAALAGVPSSTPAATSPGLAPPPPADDDAFDGGDEGNPDYQRWKARKERAAALREELRLGEEAGDLVRIADAVAVAAQAFTSVRTAFEALPDSIASTLAGESDESRVRILLADEIEHLLANLSTEISALQRKDG